MKHRLGKGAKEIVRTTRIRRGVHRLLQHRYQIIPTTGQQRHKRTQSRKVGDYLWREVLSRGGLGNTVLDEIAQKRPLQAPAGSAPITKLRLKSVDRRPVWP